MANTLVLKDLLLPSVIREVEKKMTIKAFTNRMYEGELKAKGNTVVVPIVPNITGSTGWTAGSTIPIQDTAITSDSMVVDQRYYDGRYVTDYEQLVSNFNLREELAMKIAYSLNKTHEDHIFSQFIANVYSTNQLNYSDNSSTGATVVNTDVYSHMLQMKEVLLSNDAVQEEWSIVFFINPAIAKLIKLSDIFTSTDTGLKGRIAGYLGRTIDGSDVIVSNNIPRYDVTGSTAYDSTYMLAMEKGAVNFVDQLTQFDVRKPSDAFRENLLMESIYKADVLSDTNKKKLVAKKVTNMTFTS